jgi:hypothetical protein
MDSRAHSPLGSPSLSATLGLAADLAQQVAADEVRLLKIESQEHLNAAIHRSAWLGSAALCLGVAWIGAWSAALVALEDHFSLEARLVMLAVAQCLFGAVLLARGLRRPAAPR